MGSLLVLVIESTASRYFWLDRYVRHARYDSVSQLQLPKGLEGNPNPIIALKLMTCIRTFMEAFPQSLWAIIPMLHRCMNDVSATNQYWSPIDSKEHQFIWGDLKHFYEQQNAVLYGFLEKKAYNATHMTFDTMTT